MNNAHRTKPYVVLLHGWGLSGFVTRYWAKSLGHAGYIPSTFSYRSRARTLTDNARLLAEHIRALPGSEPIHLVGHSMGGIMIMQCLATNIIENLGRVVMVGTPFQHSALAERLGLTALGRRLMGKSITQWSGVRAQDLPNGLQIGIIAGTRPFGMGRLLTKLEGPNDGTVRLSETKVPFAEDSVVMHVTHSEMLVSPAVSGQIAQFLRHGKFSEAPQKLT